MLYRFFHILALDPEQQTAVLNRFLQKHPIHSIERRFVEDGSNSFWSICIGVMGTVDEGDSATKRDQKQRNKVDYYAELGPELFAIYDRLRQKRNEIAKGEGVPAYAIFTNEQLAAMARMEQRTISALAAIDGIGEKRLKRYGEIFLSLLEQDRG